MMIFLMITILMSQMPLEHKKGSDYIASKLGEVQEKAHKTAPLSIPGFKTATPKETSITQYTIGESSIKEISKNPVSLFIKDHAKNRKMYKIDSKNDPLFINAKEAIQNPQKTMKETFILESKSQQENEFFTCEEDGESYQKICKKHLTIYLKVTPEVKIKRRYCPGHEGWRDADRANGADCRYWANWNCKEGCRFFEKITQQKRVDIEKEEWLDECQVLESYADLGLCHYVSKSHGPKETRAIQGEPVTRDYWSETFTYSCFKKTKNNCAPLRARGCIQINSQCLEKIDDICVSYKQTYQCSLPISSRSKYRASHEKSPFCLTGDCVSSGYEANTQILSTMSQLCVLKQAQDDIRKWNCIFKGQERFCTKNCVGFRDCCVSGKGWGISLGLSSCSQDEKELAHLRDQKRCVFVGTYCAEKVLGKCIRKKSSFCCFGTKLSRLIQEQGRHQLNKGWGDPKAPQCQGFSAEELSRLDFSKINLGELFEDIRKTFKPQDKTTLNLERLKENMRYMVSQ